MLGLLFRKTVARNDRIELKLTGREETGPEDGIEDSYVFDICLRGSSKPIGYVSYRAGDSPYLYYLGHIGYRIREEYRGHRYACQACELLKRYLARMGVHSLVITTNVENAPSRATCDLLGCTLERVAPVPERYRAACQGAAFKCRYIWMLEDAEDSGVDHGSGM